MRTVIKQDVRNVETKHERNNVPLDIRVLPLFQQSVSPGCICDLETI